MSLRLVMNYHYNGSVGMLSVDERCMRVLSDRWEAGGGHFGRLQYWGQTTFFDDNDDDEWELGTYWEIRELEWRWQLWTDEWW